MKLAEIRTPLLTVLIVAALVIGGVATHGQRPQGGGAPGPMLVDFAAVDATGKPVTDLTAADITIKVGGKARTITDLSLKKKTPAAAPGAPAAEAAPAAATGGISAPYFTNEASAAPAPAAAAPPAGRAYLIVVDNESLSPGIEGPIKAAIENLLKDLTPADKVAFSTAPKDTAQVGFGSSVAAVRQAVAGLRGLKSASSTDAYCRTSDTLNLLKALVQQAPGGDTTTGVSVIAGSLSQAGSSNSTSGGTCTVTQDQYNSLAGIIAGARANVYVVQGDSAAGRDSGMENLAGVTGAGAVMRVANEGFAPRVLAETSTYWVATLAPDPSDKPNQSQRLELKSVKEGVTIRTRPEVMMARAANAAAGAPAAAGKAGTSPADMAKSTASFTDLQLRANGVTLRGNGPTMNVLLQAEPVDPSVKITAMKIGFFDAAGKGNTLDPASALTTFPISTIVPVGVGQYRIRVAATDSTGKSGAVDVKIDTTPVPAGPFKLGGLMLLAKGADGKSSPRLEFKKGDVISAAFELYGLIPTAAEMIVGFEYSPVGGTGAPKQFRASGSAPTNEPDKLTVFGDLPTDLAPGDYVVSGLVQLKDNPMGKTSRTLRIK